jgi:hypothetical protein
MVSGFPLQVLANFRWRFNWLWAFRCNPSRGLGFQSKIFDTKDSQISVVDISTKEHHTQSPYQK